MKVICIDSDNKPKGIAPEEWIEEGIVYTIIAVKKMALQKTIGVKLKEIKLTEKSSPYEYYDALRFIPAIGLTSENEEEEVLISSDDCDLSSLK